MHWANFSFALRAPAFTETSTACLTPTADSNLALRAPAFTERAKCQLPGLEVSRQRLIASRDSRRDHPVPASGSTTRCGGRT